ncbi:MAG TPA: hypothetical protein VKN18_06915 [Blastocatellia bacterium]|nr:hypothetical protein [Blastocatellia bacterium]
MAPKIATFLCLMLVRGALAVPSASRQPQSTAYGPEVKSFLELMRHEDDELEFQIKHNEISRRDYVRSKTQITIHRQTVLDLVKETGKDYVPEIHVVAAPQLDQLIEDGTKAVKGLKRGDIIAEKWRYMGSVHRGGLFYIFERLSVK